ncbi:TIR domain-containing protein [Paenibacillus polymyxa]|uniref:TIR domain-containing protein n=1 Tax=Paenibacillus polymyxa TaxID=1406 RepID=UPI002023C140|nr:TIR domain-containing protein [Paenibacillus polymyxa]MDU8672536.1 TIR domain-containing protein [Paenibacillus polymyxa]MDU8697443.1 TIR domain-containing protein [Paenibacillus polymyxa]URJ56608.1 TIR domain-containing protein [Paenibacillus polymyxa]URJ64038.1 TIR domain-containing protein [Paenibacillus polymyxa]URJ71116.1 TIR domain-containing protein [Paenibacillus polymyxa]
MLAKADQELIKKGFNSKAGAILESAANQFTETKTYDIFLSHSYSDEKLVLGIKRAMEELGDSIYIDWINDRQMSRDQVSKETANTLRKRMRQCGSLLYAVSANSINSKWMPWELGYFDGIKNKVAILPITDTAQATDTYQGQEYLGLYSYITRGTVQGSNEMALWVHDSQNVYVHFTQWLQGSMPRAR